MSNDLILIAFGFSNVAMLGWLAAAAAPLLIHLWSRHRFREAPWAAMQFLLAAMRKNARRLQLQQWLLLAVRTLIILLVVSAVAEPYGQRLLAGGSAAPSHKVLVIDGSYSMAYRANVNTNFSRAKQMASELVRASRSEDVFTVILMASPPKLVVSAEVIDRAAISSRIDSLTQPYAGADFAATLDLVKDALSDKEGHKAPARKEVYFFTDLQRTTWRAPENNGEPTSAKAAHQFDATNASIAKVASLAVIDMGQRNDANLAVTRFSTTHAAITTGRDIVFAATLHEFGRDARPQCRVELLVDDVPVAEQTVDVPAGGDVSIHFVHRFSTAGAHTLTVRASGDRLDVDNSRSLVVAVRGEARVLCVAGKEGAAKYLAAALNPNPAGNSPIRPVIVAEGDLAETQLAGFDCVFLCNVAQLTANEAERLTRYAEGGGGVVFFLGDRVVPDSYNAFAPSAKSTIRNPQSAIATGAHDAPIRLIPARIGALVTERQFGLDPLDYRHPIVALFRGRERAGLLTTPVSRYYRLDVSQHRPGVEVAIATRDGDPLIVTSPLGRGRTVLVATAASLSSVDSTSGEPWTTWPTWPSYLPIVRELLAYASSGQHVRWQQLVGMPIGGVISDSSSSRAGGPELKIMRPDGREAPVSLKSLPTGWEWSYSDTDVSGIYSLRGLPHDSTQQFAVNVDTSESDLTKIDPHSLPREFHVRSAWQGEASGVTIAAMSQAAWNRPILWAVLGLLFVESFMAWQFGRGAV
jgi:hypothetical protein